MSKSSTKSTSYTTKDEEPKVATTASAKNEKSLAEEDEKVRADYIAEIKRKWNENKTLDTADQHEISIEDMKLAGLVPS